MKERWIPQGYEPFVVDGVDLLDAEFYYQVLENGVVYGIGYAGKAVNPNFHYKFKDVPDFIQYVVDFLKNRLERKQKVLANKEKRLQPHSLREGDILYASWGYDQTNVDFYKVVKLVGKNKVKIVKLGKDHVGEFKVEPNNLQGEKERLAVVNGEYNSIKFANYKIAYPWDGRPQYETPWYAGH